MLKKLIKYLVIILFILIVFSIQSNVYATMTPVNTAQGLAEYLNTVEPDSATYSGNVVTLQKDITLQEQLLIDGGTIELYFNGNTINSYGLEITGGNIKLYDDKNGGISSENGSAIRIVSGNLTIDSGTYESSIITIYADYIPNGKINITINNGNFISSKTANAIDFHGDNLTINNGYFFGCYDLHVESGNVVIKNGTFDGNMRFIVCKLF